MFEEGKSYKDRVGNQYVYLYKSGGVSIFSLNGVKTCRHIFGKYRWDDKETEMDIVNV
jgi:hypothetical protein